MGIYIPITLLRREGQEVYYEYSQPIHAPDPTKAKRLVEVGKNVGVVRVNINTHDVVRVSGEDWDNGFFCTRVQVRLLKHLKEEKTMPDVTSYAA